MHRIFHFSGSVKECRRRAFTVEWSEYSQTAAARLDADCRGARSRSKVAIVVPRWLSFFGSNLPFRQTTARPPLVRSVNGKKKNSHDTVARKMYERRKRRFHIDSKRQPPRAEGKWGSRGRTQKKVESRFEGTGIFVMETPPTPVAFVTRKAPSPEFLCPPEFAPLPPR